MYIKSHICLFCYPSINNTKHKLISSAIISAISPTFPSCITFNFHSIGSGATNVSFSYPSLLQKKLGKRFHVGNYGVGGASASRIRYRLGYVYIYRYMYIYGCRHICIHTNMVVDKYTTFVCIDIFVLLYVHASIHIYIQLHIVCIYTQ